MEKKFFTWCEWDRQDTKCFSFYDCVFNADIGAYRLGNKIDNIVMDYENGKMTFFIFGKKDITGYRPVLCQETFVIELNVIE